MTDSDIGQLASTQEWVKERAMVHDRAWSEGQDDIRREQEQDARESLVRVECAICSEFFWTDDAEDALCGPCVQQQFGADDGE